jgi:hypothetical protein
VVNFYSFSQNQYNFTSKCESPFDAAVFNGLGHGRRQDTIPDAVCGDGEGSFNTGIFSSSFVPVMEDINSMLNFD